MKRSFFSLCSLVSVLSCLLLAVPLACDPPSNPKQDGSTEKSKGDGSVTPEISNPDQPTTGNWPPPAGYAAVEFSIDDSANKTYKDGNLRWNGSFIYDAKTNIIVYASAWQPTDGPFPPLYDDGPIDQGGHEPRGSVKGDSIFGTVVFIKPDPAKDLEFEYGLINEDDNWLWEGNNGRFTVAKGSTNVIKAQGLKLAKHGGLNIKITLNLKDLPEEFKPDDPANPPPVFIKGIMSNWAPIQLSDSGSRGDETASDGILTYVQKEVLDYSPHFGLLQANRHVQFVFQFNSATGREYKDIDDRAISSGVTAWADCNNDGKFTDDEKQTIVWEKDSRGAVENTTIIVCEGKTTACTAADCAEARCKNDPVCQKPGCKTNADCKTGETCNPATGDCKPETPPCTAADCSLDRCKNDPVCQKPGCSADGECKTDEFCDLPTKTCKPKAPVGCKTDGDCKADEVCEASTTSCKPKPCTPGDCALPRCTADPVCSNPNQDPIIYLLTPNVGPLAGGTEITIDGDRFKQGVKVKFGTQDATDVTFASDKKITCKTPATTAASEVDVLVTNPDGRSNLFPLGFRYDDKVVNPNTFSVVSIEPSTSLPKGGSTVRILGGGFAAGLAVRFGTTGATSIKVVSKTELEVVVPAGTIGRVDIDVEQAGQVKKIAQGFTYTGFQNTVDWCMLQWPKSIPDAANSVPPAYLGQASPTIYGRVWKDGVTAGSGPGAGLVAHVGYGPTGSDPTQDNAWIWFNARFNVDVSNDDEFQGSLTIPTAGTYDYAFRFSGDGGINFWYCDLDGNTTGKNGTPNQPYRTSKAAKVTATP